MSPPTLLPKWLCAVSDVVRQLVVDGGEFYDDADDYPSALHHLVHLPTCAVDCADGELYYHVLRAWCVPWTDVPKPHFLKAWFALGADKRRELVHQNKAFADELLPDLWLQRMAARDDVDMFDAAMAVSADGTEVMLMLRTLVYFGAMQCLECWVERCGGDISVCRAALTKTIPAPADSFDLGYPKINCVVDEKSETFHDECWATAAATTAFNPGTSMLRFLRERLDCPINDLTCAAAAGRGRVDCLAYLCEHGCLYDGSAIVVAAEYGHLDCIAYLHERGYTWWSDTMCHIAAAKNGHFACTEYLLEHGCPWSDRVFNYLVWSSTPNMDAVKYLHEHGCPWNMEVFTAACRGGNRKCIQYLRENGCPLSLRMSVYTAISTNNVDVLAYLTGSCIGSLVDHDLCKHAAMLGSAECLRYLRENGCPWNEDVFYAALRYGSSECVQYLLDHGCPWDRYTITCAMTQGQWTCAWDLTWRCVR